MSLYTLNGISLLDNFNYHAGKQADSNIAMQGCWDMPARTGKTFHDWGTENGIEAYVLADEIRFAGRDISFTGYVKGADEYTAQQLAFNYYTALDAFTGLVPLTSNKFGTRNVYVNGEITATYLGEGWMQIVTPFREPIVDLTGSVPVETNPFIAGIDGINFSTLGLNIMSMQSKTNRPAPKGISITAYQNEAYQVTKTGARNIQISAFIYQNSYTDFVNVIKGLYQLFSSPGLRSIYKPNDVYREFFIQNGFQLTGVTIKPDGSVYGFIDFEITEVSGGDTAYTYLTDVHYTLILTGSAQQILIK